VIRFEGTVQLIDVAITEAYQPNVFLDAACVKDHQLFVDQKEIIVPPAEKFLKLEIKHAKARFEPQEKEDVTIQVTGDDGKPRAAELAIGVADESVYAIQSDPAGDIREFFYGRKRQALSQTISTFQLLSYQKGKWDEDKKNFELEEDFRRDGVALDGLMKDEERGYARRKAGFAGGKVSRSELAADAVGGMAAQNAPAATSMPVAREAMKSANAKELSEEKQSGSPNVVVRSDFRATVFWEPLVSTDAHGLAKISIQYPDSLTAWKTVARAATADTSVGMAETTTRTKKDLLVRLETPRFLTEKDQATLSGIVQNDTDDILSAEVKLEADGVKLADGGSRKIKIKPHAEERVDWKASAEKSGEARVVLTAVSGKLSDAMERKLPVQTHGVEKFEGRAGWLNADQDTAALELDIPAERTSGSAMLEVAVAPSIATTCLDALPYLADYPYGCVEQTMSRFLPAVVVARTLDDLKLDRKAVETRIFGGIEPQHAGKTHPEGSKDLRKLDDMVGKGLDRLADMQHGDGGWGWWKESASDPFMTAYVVQGLLLSQEAGVSVPSHLIGGGLNYLSKTFVEAEGQYDLQSFLAYSLTLGAQKGKTSLSPTVRQQMENLWNHRDRLNAYSRALLALSFSQAGDAAKAKTLVENLDNGIQTDAAAQTAHWGNDGIYYRWSEGGVEATAWALRAMLAIDPKNAHIGPAMNWLVKNRRGAQWSNTRDTAMVVLALTDYLRVTRELAADLDYEVLVNGKRVGQQKITRANALDARSVYRIGPDVLRDGKNRVEFRKHGSSKLYYATYLRYFSREEPITPAGYEISVKREYFRFAGRPTLLKGYVYDKVPLHDGETVRSGERVEVRLTVEAKNNYEYLVFEDLKPAGLEAVQLQSGEPIYADQLKAELYRKEGKEETSGRSEAMHQELRDRKVAFFISKLPEGVHQIRYELRAESPGEFHALPTLGHAMYVPEIRANSGEIRIKVAE
ncbi:MAG: alpha-2-macroglobulin, partial [Verrucomicrobiae bacterium]|nr:alpha-2-macroglobulin [Verrucomicrobiae bacterium]